MQIPGKEFSWWSSLDPARTLFDCVTAINRDQADRTQANLRNIKLYGNYPVTGFGLDSIIRTPIPTLPENRVKLNIISSMCDTVSAKISKMKPRVRFLTTRGDWNIQQKSKKLTQFNDGLFYKNNIYTLHQQMFKDSTIFDLGALKHYRRGKEIVTERVMGYELFVDTSDGMYGRPRNLYHVSFIHKDTLKSQFPDHKLDISRSAGTFDRSANMDHTKKDFALVIEGWRLPDGDSPGKHIIATDCCELLNEDWKKDYFPFTFYRWTDPIIGFYGQSLAERLVGNQVEINKMLRVIQRAFHLGSSFKIFLEYGSRVPKEQLNNEIGSIVYYAGQAPVFATPSTVNPEYFNHLRYLVQSSYEEAGVSQMSAASRIPAGIDGGSGRAIREYNDLETERFIIQAQRYEATFLETARQYVDLAKEIGDIEVVAESKRFLEAIKWSDVDLEDNEYVLQMFPVAKLPNDPAGRLKLVEDYYNLGWISREEARSLLDFPDTPEMQSLADAEMEEVQKAAYLMLYEGQPQMPQPITILPQAIKWMRLYYTRARNEDAPQERLDLVLEWITRAQSMIDKAAEATQVAQAGLPTPQGSLGPTATTPLAPVA